MSHDLRISRDIQRNASNQHERGISREKMSIEQCVTEQRARATGSDQFGAESMDSPGEIQSDFEGEEEGEAVQNQAMEQQVVGLSRLKKLKQEFDIESLASASSSSPSTSLSPPTNNGPITTCKRQTFLAAQLAEPNEMSPSAYLSATYQQLQHGGGGGGSTMPSIAHNSEARGNNSPKEAEVVNNNKDQVQKVHQETRHQQPQQQGNNSSSGNGGGGGGTNIDYDEHVKHVDLFGVKIVALTINNRERLCLAQISNTLLKNFSYNEIHNRRVALGITCVQCTPIQLEMLRRAGAMPSSSRRCGMITMREAERLCRSFLAEEQPPELPENFYFNVGHRVNYGCKGRFIPSRYISSRAKCIECFHCGEFYSPNKFIFHSHKQPDVTDCNPPDSPNINSWRKHINLDWTLEHSQEIKYAWEDVKSLFNGGTRRRTSAASLGGGGGGGCGARDRGASLTPEHRATTPIAHEPLDGDNQQQQQQQRRAEHHAASRSQPQRPPPPPQAAMSQSERRKLPISSWPKHQQHQPKKFAHHPWNQHQQHPQQLQQLQRPLGPDEILIQQRQIQHQAQPSAYSSSKQHNTSTSSSGVGSSNNNNNNNNNNIYPRTVHCATTRHSGVSAQNQKQTHRAADAQQKSINATQAGGSALPHANAQQQHHSVRYLVHSSDVSTVQPSFTYGQLYSQLMQSQLNQQQQQQQQQQQHQQQASQLAAANQQRQPSQISTLEAQLALRHHIWSNLLANFRSNPSVFDALTNLHQQTPMGLEIPSAPTATTTSANHSAAIQLASQQQSSQQHNRPSSLLRPGLTATGQLCSALNDLSNQASPSDASNPLSPFQSLLPPMQLYGPSVGQVATSHNALAAQAFNSSAADNCHQ